MPHQSTRGNPVNWHTKPAYPHEDLKGRKARNEQHPCIVPGCDTKRRGVSSMCRYHSKKMSHEGDPIAQQPTKAELEVFKQVIARERQREPGEDAKVLGEIKGQIKAHWTRPPQWAAKPSDMHRKMTQQAKAEVIKGHLSKTQIDLEPMFVHALAVQGWVMLRFRGLPQYRKRFLETQCGKWATRRGSPKQTFKQVKAVTDRTTVIHGPEGPKHPVSFETYEQVIRPFISGTVERRLGEEIIRGTNAAFGRDWWDREFSGTNKTRLDIALSAMQQAGLVDQPTHQTPKRNRQNYGN